MLVSSLVMLSNIYLSEIYKEKKKNNDKNNKNESKIKCEKLFFFRKEQIAGPFDAKKLQ
jgi:hypothetical protein